ncbi:MAG: decarboxylase [Nanobdellota archaeon]
MSEAKFLLSTKKLKSQISFLKEMGLKISYSYKTNNEVGKILQDKSDCDFSIHAQEELNDIKDKSRIWFFLQAEKEIEIIKIINEGVRKFVVDNEVDFNTLNAATIKNKSDISLSLRMKFKENRIGSGKYFVYGMKSKKVEELIKKASENKYFIKKGVHIHRKSQNTSEWEIKEELQDSLSPIVLNNINFVNLGGGLPIKYRSYTMKVMNYISLKMKEAVNWLKDNGIESYIEPGRFIAGPSIKLKTEIIQIHDKNIILNTTIYNCALDTFLTGTKMLVEEELDDKENGEHYLLKGNSPTRDDIFRYKAKLKNPEVGDKITFLNAGAYNYTTDFFGYKKLKTEIID